MYKSKNPFGSGYFYAPYIPLNTFTIFTLVEVFQGINVVNEYPITKLQDINAQSGVLYRVHDESGNKRFLIIDVSRNGYAGMHEEVYVSDEIPIFQSFAIPEDTRHLLKCTEEEFLMFVLKYGEDFKG